MNLFDYEKSDISSAVLNQDYFKGFEENEDHHLLDMDSLVPRKDVELISRIYESSMKKSFLGGDNDSDSRTANNNNNNNSGSRNNQDGEQVMHWPTKPIEEWGLLETSNWLTAAASCIGQSYGTIQQSLIVTGRELLTLTLQEFLGHDPVFGDRLHSLLHTQHMAAKGASLDGYFHGGGGGDGGGQGANGRQQEQRRDYGGERTAAETFQKLSIKDEQQNNGSNNASDAESDNSVEISTKRPPGRPRLTKTKKNPTSQGKLWEFIRDLLRNRNTCPSLICWEDYSQAKFRFVRSDEVAKLWGSRKGNTKMTYEKLSRAMRYYYKRKIFLPVLGRRLVYQFGPNATGWQTDNPNFRLY